MVLLLLSERNDAILVPASRTAPRTASCITSLRARARARAYLGGSVAPCFRKQPNSNWWQHGRLVRKSACSRAANYHEGAKPPLGSKHALGACGALEERPRNYPKAQQALSEPGLGCNIGTAFTASELLHCSPGHASACAAGGRHQTSDDTATSGPS